MNTKDIDLESLKLKVLVYGKSGTGKTTFASSFPKPYFFDCDNGMLSQRGKDVEYDVYSEYPVFVKKLNELEKSDTYETLVVDSVTNLEKMVITDLLRLNNRTEMTLHEWGLLIRVLSDLFNRMTKMNKHIVITAHEHMLQDELTSEVWILPLVVGKKLPAQLPLWFDEVYRTQVGKDSEGNTTFQSITTASTKYTAKSRLKVLKPIEDNLTYAKLMEKIKGGK